MPVQGGIEFSDRKTSPALRSGVNFSFTLDLSGMTQASLFPDESIDPTAPIDPSPSMPTGFSYRAQLIGAREEAELLKTISALTFKPYEFRGFQANRKVAAFGYLYSYNTRRMESAQELPPWLKELRVE